MNPPRESTLNIHSLATRRQNIYTALNDQTLGWKQRTVLVAELRHAESDSNHEYAQVRRERAGQTMYPTTSDARG